MAIPKAIVKVRLDALNSIPASYTAGGQIVYATTKIGNRELGRTAPIPAGSTSLAVNRELEVALGDNDTLVLQAYLWEERGDDAPVNLGSVVKAPPSVPGKSQAGSGPVLAFTIIEWRLVPEDARPPIAAPRNSKGAPKSPASIKPVRAFCIEIIEILGLHDPGYAAPPNRRANYNPGYISQDHKGRIYLNQDLNGDWVKDTQLIQLTAKVTVRGGKLPAGAKIRWTVSDPDDPFDDLREVHREWGWYIDPKDYGPSPSHTPLGAQGNDNEGKPDRSPAWEVVPGFALTGPTATQASTAIAAGQISKVKLHCPNVAGDNLIVRAEFEPASPEEVFAAETGIMTMWTRVDVEYNKMDKAFDLSKTFPAVAGNLEPACIQLDFVPEPAGSVLPEQAQMSRHASTLETDSAAYIDKNFKHRGQKGWFCLFSAMEPHALPARRGEVYFEDEVTLQADPKDPFHQDFIVFSGDHADASYVEITWAGKTVGFDVDSDNKPTKVTGRFVHETQCWLLEHDMTPEFKAGDGSAKAAYLERILWAPRGKIVMKTSVWSPGGYGISAKVHAKVFGPGRFYNSGISPPAKIGGEEYFSGRTVVFSHHSYYRDEKGNPKPDFEQKVTGTITHELTHAFGMPHKCGHWNYRTRREHTCCMNYSPNWMLDASGALKAGTSEKVGPDLCGMHIKELRRVHLEDSLGLGW